MDFVFDKLKDKLSKKEFDALRIAVDNYEKDAPSFFKVCLECRIDISKARQTLDLLRKNINSFASIFEYVSAVKTIYLTDRNLRQTKECAYDISGDLALLKTALFTVTANAHIVSNILEEKDILVLCKAIKMFNDLIFFASETNENKQVYSLFLQSVENKLGYNSIPLSLSLCPAYLSFYPLEKMEELLGSFDKIFGAIKNTKNTGEVVFWAEKGLAVYGYNIECEKLREWAIDKYLTKDERFSSSLISEIIINN